MKTIASTTFLALLAMAGAAFAQLPSQPSPNVINDNNGVVRDGFTLTGGHILITRKGVTEGVLKEYVLANGTHVYPDGDIRLSDGMTVHLKPNQILTMTGEFQDTTVTAGVAPVVPPEARGNNEVGISSRDGISVSGGETFVTRNGVTKKNTSEFKFENGMKIFPDGTVLKPGGSKFTLREDQVMGFDGEIHSAQVRENIPEAGTTKLVVPVR